MRTAVVKPSFGSLDEGVVDIDFLYPARHDEQRDDAEEYQVGSHARHGAHRLRVHLSESPDGESDEGHETADGHQQHGLQQVDALPQRGDDDARDGGHARSQQDGDEDVGGSLCAIGGTEGENRRGDDGQSRGVEHQKHNHRVGGRVFLGIQFLHLRHGPQSGGRGGIVEAEHVGGDVHEDGSDDGMILGDVGEESGEHRTECPRQYIDHSGALTDFHDSQPEREHARQTQRHLESAL